MSFSFSLKPGLVARPRKIRNPFGDVVEDGNETTTTQQPLDYVKARLESEQRRAALAAAESRYEVNAEVEDEGEISSVDRIGIPLGPVGVGVKSLTSSTERKSESISRPGLVKLNEEPRTGPKNVKHIQRMVETSQVNEKFKNLLKMKMAEKDKVKAEEEFGSKPEEFITSAYQKQREESLALEKELEAKESSFKKRDMTNLFREMLDSGSYARSNFQENKIVEEPRKSVDKLKVEVKSDSVQRVLDKVVSEESKEVVKAIEQRTKLDVLKIVQQVEEIVGNEDDEGEIQARRMSAKERFLERKRQRQNEQ
jgi:hypothetical protein